MDDLGLEPIDPFVDDVFAGMDDHPPGLWHPTLVAAPLLQHHAVDAAGPSGPFPHSCAASNGGGSGRNSYSDGFSLSHDDMLTAQLLPQEEMMPQQQLPAPLGHQHDVAAGVAEAAEAVAAGPTDHSQLLGLSGLQLQPAAEAAAQAQEDAAPGHPISSASSTHRLQQQADACSGSQGFDAAAVEGGLTLDHNNDDIAGANSDDKLTSSMQQEQLQQEQQQQGHQQEQQQQGTGYDLGDAVPVAPAGVDTDGAATTATGEAAAAADGVVGAAGVIEAAASEDSVPDIDDVSEEQIVAASQPQQAWPPQQVTLRQQGEQQEEQQQHWDKQQLLPYQQLDLRASQHAQQSTEQQQHQQQQQQQEQHQQQQEQQAQQQQQDCREVHMLPCSDEEQEIRAEQQLACVADDSLQHTPTQPPAAAAAAPAAQPASWTGTEREAPHAASAASAAYQPTAAAKPDDPSGTASSSSSNGSESETEAPAAAPAGAVDDECGDFASPNTSWHSCMTSASHASTHAVLTAASFASARGGMSVLTTLLPCQQQQQQQCSSNSRGGGVAEPAAAVGDAPSSSGSQCAGGAAAEEPAATSSLAAAAVHSQSVQQARMWSTEQPAEAEEGGLAGREAAATAATQLKCTDHHVTLPDDPLGASSMQQQQQQRQQQQQDEWQAEQQQHPQQRQQQQQQQQGLRDDDVWQDVLPPSLGSSPPSPGYTTIEQHHIAAAAAAAAAAERDPTIAEGAAAPADVEGHGRYYGAAPRYLAASASQAGLMLHPGGLTSHQAGLMYHHHPGHASVAASSCMLRQSELVDLSLSTSMHPGQQQQQQRPGWLTAHQQLPPAAAQAVERAVSALNDSYFYHGRPAAGSMIGAPLQPGHSMMAQQGAGGSSAAGLGGSGVAGLAIRRSAGPQWSATLTHPQQDQQARHRLPSQGGSSQAGPLGGWSGPAVLGQWFSSTVQQPLAAVAGRAAARVGQRLGAAGSVVSSAVGSRAGSSSSSSQGAAGQAAYVARAGSSSTRPAAAASALPQTSSGSGSSRPSCGAAAGWDADGFEDAVLVEHTPDLPQSLQEQEDEAFRGLVFLGGRDSHGWPVVIVNTDAIPAGHNPAPRDAALTYLVNKLTPVVTRGPYVLVMVAFQHGPQFRLLPGVWCVRAYHTLPRAFRKNVKHVLLLQPSLMVRAGLALLYPFVSSKAHTKIKQVARLLDIEAATAGEVQVPHLGEAFLTALQHLNRTQQQQQQRQQRLWQQPQNGASQPGQPGGMASGVGSGRTVPVPGAMMR